jgi:hypothetical protein
MVTMKNYYPSFLDLKCCVSIVTGVLASACVVKLLRKGRVLAGGRRLMVFAP